MQEIEPADYFRAKALFTDLTALHGSVRAVLDGVVNGSIVVDDPGTPSWALLDGPEGLYLGGGPVPGRDYAALRSAIPAWAYVYPSAAWFEAPSLAMPHPYMQRHERIHMWTKPHDNGPPYLPDGLELVVETDGELRSAIRYGGEVVAHCKPDLRAGDMVEIGVWTRPDMRRRGLAGAVVEATLAQAARAGVTRVGWHCHASNVGSIAVARKAGFGGTVPYVAWSASLPAENSGDLDREQSVALAHAFEAGRDAFPWLDFHAVWAWAEAGDTGRALFALERLVSGRWDGEAGWLSGHWAAARLRDDARFTRAVEAQSRK